MTSALFFSTFRSSTFSCSCNRRVKACVRISLGQKEAKDHQEHLVQLLLHPDALLGLLQLRGEGGPQAGGRGVQELLQTDTSEAAPAPLETANIPSHLSQSTSGHTSGQQGGSWSHRERTKVPVEHLQKSAKTWRRAHKHTEAANPLARTANQQQALLESKFETNCSRHLSNRKRRRPSQTDRSAFFFFCCCCLCDSRTAAPCWMESDFHREHLSILRIFTGLKQFDIKGKSAARSVFNG